MLNYGFIRVAAAMPVVHVADPKANAEEIIRLSESLCRELQPSVIVFPELSVTGYTCADLFGQEFLIKTAETAVEQILAHTLNLGSMLVFGVPVRHAGRLFNCAVVARRGKILGIVPKTYMAGNGEFYEPRWFESARVLPQEGARIRYAGNDTLMRATQLFRMGEALIGIEICQDLWSPVPPSSFAALAGAQLILNLSASNEFLSKHEYRKSLVSSTSSRLYAAYVYSSSAYGESTQDLVWAGSSLIYENGACLAEAERFYTGSNSIGADVDVQRLEHLRAVEHSYRFEGPVPEFITTDAGEPVDSDFGDRLFRYVEPHPFVPHGDSAELDRRCREIMSAQVAGLMTRLEHIRCRKAVIGVSGGLDSTLALLVTVLAFDRLRLPRENIIGITMPGFGTTGRTYKNSLKLMEHLGITSREISIVAATRQHFADIGQDEDKHDLTYENCQARERTQILMDTAGLEGGIVIGTGDLSELALGWCTYNGDHMSMYAVNVSVPKTLVRTLVTWGADNKFDDSTETREILLDIVDTPISPELLPAGKEGEIVQKTEDSVGPYELHDFFLYHFFRSGSSPSKLRFMAIKAFGDSYTEEEIEKWLRVFLKRFFSQQFKRSCIPDGPKVGSVSLSPRGDWRMPSDLEKAFPLE